MHGRQLVGEKKVVGFITGKPPCKEKLFYRQQPDFKNKKEKQQEQRCFCCFSFFALYSLSYFSHGYFSYKEIFYCSEPWISVIIQQEAAM